MNTSSSINDAPINDAIYSQLIIMEHFVTDLLDHVREAQERIEAGERNGAIGALLGCSEAFEHLRTFYDAIIVMHRNAALIERARE